MPITVLTSSPAASSSSAADDGDGRQRLLLVDIAAEDGERLLEGVPVLIVAERAGLGAGDGVLDDVGVVGKRPVDHRLGALGGVGRRRMLRAQAGVGLRAVDVEGSCVRLIFASLICLD